MKRLLLLVACACPMVARAQTATGWAAFNKTIETYRQQYDAAQTIDQKSQLVQARNHALCLNSSTLAPWGGVINNLAVTGDGAIMVVLQIGPDIYVETAQPIPGLLAQNMGLTNMKIGDEVMFMASFVAPGFEYGGPCIEDANSDADEFMNKPQILMNLITIEPVPWKN